MDFNELKKKALEIKGKIVEGTDKIITTSASKIQESGLTIHSVEELDLIINKSENTFYTSAETGEKKESIKRSIVIIGDPEKDFFKEALYILPLIATKAFTQSISVKLASNIIEGVDYTKYGVKDFPSMIIFENKKVNKIITGRLNILKLVKSFSLDINKSIDDFVELEITSVDDLKKKATEKVEEVKDKTVEKMEDIKEEAKEKVSKKVKEVKKKTEDKVDEVKIESKKKIVKKVKEVKEKIEK